MWRRCTYLVLLTATLALVQGSVAYGAFDILRDPGLVAWWTLDDGQGATVLDSSPGKHNGTVVNGTAGWVPGVYGGAIELKIPVLVQIPAINVTMTQCTMAGWIKRIGSQADWSSFIMTRGTATGFNLVANQLAYHWNDDSATWSARPTAPVPDGQWTFCAVTIDSAKAVFYINGNQVYVNTVSHGSNNWNADIFLGGDGTSGFPDRRLADGMLDDVSLWSRALTADEIKVIMKGLIKPELAASPNPADAAVDVPQDASLSWQAGQGATSHDVYLGTSFADVNSASVASPKNVLVSPGQAATTYAPAKLLDFGQTYSWRVDENGAGNFKGNVWSFTVEPYSYPIKGVIATASSAQNGMGPENAVNGSGLTGDMHGNDPMTMWMSKGTLPNWIQFQFDNVYKLDKMLVWNSNQMIEAFIGFGAKDVTVEYSTDGATWTALANVPEFAQATALPTYTANTTVSFGGAMAKFVKLTINKSWGGLPSTGLAEVRFTSIPVQARAPQPAAGSTGASISSVLNWRPGREATSHSVFFGTDANAVANGTVAAKTVTAHSFDPGAMTFGTKYFWKVDEVGGSGPYAGNLWSFTTQEFAAIDDMESYNDEDNRIYDTWIDGLADGKSNSVVGYDKAPFAEQTIVHGGKQSMPLSYDNTKAPFYSEAMQEFPSAQNWTASGADTLSLWFCGRAPDFLDKGDGTYTMSSSGTDIWNNDDQFRFAYKTLTGDGAIVARVDSIVNTNVWAKAGVMIRQSTEGGSTHAFMPIDPGGSSAGNGASFQRRLTPTGSSSNDDKPAPAIAPPYWVKVERKGNSFTGSISPDGKTWTQLGSAQTILMSGPVLIGLAVCSHDATKTTVAEFSNVSTTGSVTGSWQAVAIGATMPTNGAAPIYLVVEDKAGKSKMVVNTNPSATIATTWTEWRIPLSDLAGVSLTTVKKLTIGVGDKAGPKAGAAGTLYIDDIGYGHPAK